MPIAGNFLVTVSGESFDSVDRIAQLLSRYKFTGIGSLLICKFDVSNEQNQKYINIKFSVNIPDRDSQLGTDLKKTWRLLTSWIDNSSDKDIRLHFEKEFKRLWCHEFDESVKFDGELIRDPHSWEDIQRYHDELLKLEHERHVGTRKRSELSGIMT